MYLGFSAATQHSGSNFIALEDFPAKPTQCQPLRKKWFLQHRLCKRLAKLFAKNITPAKDRF
jgi:hypothetical protein